MINLSIIKEINMPDNRKHIVVEPETHQSFMDFTVEIRKTQDAGLNYLLRQDRLLKKMDKKLYEKIKFTIN